MTGSMMVVVALKKYRQENLGPAKEGSGEDRELSREIADLVFSDHFAFLVGAVFQRGMRWYKAFEIPYRIHERGELDALKLASKSEDELQKLLQSLSVKPRYGGARTLKDTASLMVQFDIWHSTSPKEVLKRLQAIHGVGPGIAHMTVRILRDEWELFRGQEHEIDVKADVQVMRVFKRTGLTQAENEGDAVDAARRLNPEFPGELDWPAWDIGMKWCRPTNPFCGSCPLREVCPKHL